MQPISLESARRFRARTDPLTAGRWHDGRAGRSGVDGVSDALLMTRLSAGDCGALDALLERHWPAVYRYAWRRTGSRAAGADLAQTAFRTVWARRTSWEDGTPVRALLFRIVRQARPAKRVGRGPAARPADRLRVEAASETAAERGGMRSAIEEAAEALPAMWREVLLFRLVDDLSHDEIASVLCTTREAVADTLSDALAELRLVLADHLD